MFYKVSRVISLIVFAALIIIPSAIVVMGSSKTDAEVYNKPLALPERWTLDNFRFLFEVSNVGRSFLNSIIVTGFSVTITLILASMCAFAISRMITVTGKVLFSLFAVGLAIPGQVNLVPIFILFNDLQLTNKLSGLILINVVTTLPISVFILTAFFRELPKECTKCPKLMAQHHFGYIAQSHYLYRVQQWAQRQSFSLLLHGMNYSSHYF